MGGAGQSDGFVLLADRVHRFDYPLDRLFSALTAERERWLRLAPGEVHPRLLDEDPPFRVVWSSFWPASPNDRIELDLSLAGPEYILHTRAGMDRDRRRQTLLQMRWWTDSPPDARGIGITRQRLNQKLGGDLRGVTTEYWWEGK